MGRRQRTNAGPDQRTGTSGRLAVWALRWHSVPMSENKIEIPADLLPRDGRFGSGPSKVRQEAVIALAEVAPTLLGTSHRKPTVKDQVKRLRQGLASLFELPDGYEVALGNGGSTLFWDAATFHLIRERSAHAVFGEFSSKFAKAAKTAPHLGEPTIFESAPGTHPTVEAVDGVDVYALTHNETSTGVAMPLSRPSHDGLVLVDATSGAGGIGVDLREVDAYYFAPQKAFASEGGLWLALLSPAAIGRIQELSSRWAPEILNLATALENARQEQTYNTPSLSTIFLMAEQVDWMNSQGGLAWSTKATANLSGHVYDWAEQRDFASPFVANPAERSPVTCTIDLDDAVAADDLTKVLRANGILDIDAYRKLGRNQVRIATFPAIDQGDIEALTACIDYVAERL